MKELKLFVCDSCGTQYKDREKAKQCEKSHNYAKEIANAAYHANADYPDRIEVCFLDGKKIWYKR